MPACRPSGFASGRVFAINSSTLVPACGQPHKGSSTNQKGKTGGGPTTSHQYRHGPTPWHFAICATCPSFFSRCPSICRKQSSRMRVLRAAVQAKAMLQAASQPALRNTGIRQKVSVLQALHPSRFNPPLLYSSLLYSSLLVPTGPKKPAFVPVPLAICIIFAGTPQEQ